MDKSKNSRFPTRRYGEYKDLKTLLFNRNISYDALAQAINMSPTAFNNKINGYVDFKLEDIFRICNELNIEYSFLLDEKFRNSTKICVTRKN